MEAKGIDNLLTDPRKLEQALGEAGVQLEKSYGEKTAVIVTRKGTSLSDSTITATTRNWLNTDTYGKLVKDAVIHVNENKLIYVSR